MPGLEDDEKNQMMEDSHLRLVLSLLVILAVGCSKNNTGPAPASPTERLAAQVQQERQASLHVVDGYAPKVEGHIDRLDAPATEIMRQLPGVAGVEVLVASAKPTHRIIQLRDWHYVPRELFALDVRQQTS